MHLDTGVVSWIVETFHFTKDPRSGDREQGMALICGLALREHTKFTWDGVYWDSSLSWISISAVNMSLAVILVEECLSRSIPMTLAGCPAQRPRRWNRTGKHVVSSSRWFATILWEITWDKLQLGRMWFNAACTPYEELVDIHSIIHMLHWWHCHVTNIL